MKIGRQMRIVKFFIMMIAVFVCLNMVSINVYAEEDPENTEPQTEEITEEPEVIETEQVQEEIIADPVTEPIEDPSAETVAEPSLEEEPEDTAVTLEEPAEPAAIETDEQEETDYDKAVALFQALPLSDSITDATSDADKNTYKEQLTAAMQAYEALTEEDQSKLEEEHSDLLENAYALNDLFTGNEAMLLGTTETVYVAQIGDAKYETLASAFEAVTDGQTVQIINDITENSTDSNSLIITDKKFTLDLNGHSITGTANGANGSTYYIRLSGTNELIITDSSTGGTGSLSATYAGSSHTRIIDVESGCKLTLNKGTLTNTNTIARSASIVYVSKNGTFVMNGGTVSAIVGASASYANYGVNMASGATFTMYGGSVLNSSLGNAVAFLGIANIYGGTITSTYKGTNVNKGIAISGSMDSKSILTISGNPHISGHKNAIYLGQDQKCSISGGYYSNNVTEKPVIDRGSAKELLITGGYFNTDPSVKPANIAEGYAVTASTVDGYSFQVTKAVAQIGDKYYATLSDAVNASADGDTINLLSDLDYKASTSIEILNLKANSVLDLQTHNQCS